MLCEVTSQRFETQCKEVRVWSAGNSVSRVHLDGQGNPARQGQDRSDKEQSGAKDPKAGQGVHRTVQLLQGVNKGLRQAGSPTEQAPGQGRQMEKRRTARRGTGGVRAAEGGTNQSASPGLSESEPGLPPGGRCQSRPPGSTRGTGSKLDSN